jgi:ppGpp synthetase/RelA/SpoT-type nucleotidyltranferase
MNLQDYKKNKLIYKKFAKYIEKYLERLIKKENKSGERYNLHHVQSRAKDFDSLARKLKTKNVAGSKKIENIIYDLAGCRIIFLSNDDVNKFIHSRIIREHFYVNEERSKIHYLNDGERYIGDHYVIQLKVKSPAYKQEFKGLFCEIQIQTILNHAWSETNHNIGYKEPDLQGFGRRVLDKIKEKLGQVADQHIIKAGHEFQKIKYDYDRLVAGKEVIDRNVIHIISSEVDNNERYDILTRYQDYVLPNIDDLKEFFDEIVEVSKLGIQVSKKRKDGLIKTSSGDYPGRTKNDIFNVCISMLEKVSWYNIEVVFNVLIDFYKNGIEQEKIVILKTMEEISEYRVNILNYLGLSNHFKLLSIINSWNDNDLVNLKDIILLVCKAILHPTAVDVKSTYSQTTFGRPSFVGDNNLDDLRDNAINLLIRLDSVVPKDNYVEKQKINIALQVSTQIPPYQNENDKLINIIQKNTSKIVSYYLSTAKTDSYDLLEGKEKQCLHLYKLYNDIRNSNIFSDAVKDVSLEIIKLINEYKKLINSDSEYGIYKTLVGYEFVSDCSWESSYVEDVYAREAARNQSINNFIKSVNKSNSKKWFARIILCTKSKYTNGLTFNFFFIFLEHLGKEKPQFLFDLVAGYENEISRFLSPILSGLLNSKMSSKAHDLIKKWVNDGKHLFEILSLFKNNFNEMELKLLEKIIDQSAKLMDVNTLASSLPVIISNYNLTNLEEMKKLFLKTIQYVTCMHEPRWINVVWYEKSYVDFISQFDKIILKSIENYSNATHELEYILSPIAQNYPDLVIKYFEQRMKIQYISKSISSYDWIPYEFQKVHKFLSINPKNALKLVCKWYNGNFDDFIFTGGKFLYLIFSDFNVAFETELLKLVKANNEDNIKIVLGILRNYKGGAFLHNICKILIETLPSNSRWLEEVEVVLLSTGILSGEFAFSNKYAEKKAEILAWEHDKNSKVKKFAKKYIAYLNKLIPSEKRRTTQDIEIRKHMWGED